MKLKKYKFQILLILPTLQLFANQKNIALGRLNFCGSQDGGAEIVAETKAMACLGVALAETEWSEEQC